MENVRSIRSESRAAGESAEGKIGLLAPEPGALMQGMGDA